MLLSIAAALALMTAPPSRSVDAAFLKGVEACHGRVYDDLDSVAFLQGAGFTQVTQTEFEYDWRWRGEGFEIQAWGNMFGCGSKILQGRMSDREALGVVRPWAERHGYLRPFDPEEQGTALLYLMIKSENGFYIALDRDEAGLLQASMAPGYFVDR